VLESLVNLYVQQGKVDEAAALCRKSILNDPKSALLHNLMGRVLGFRRNTRSCGIF